MNISSLNHEISSDSTTLYILTILLLLISVFFVLGYYPLKDKLEFPKSYFFKNQLDCGSFVKVFLNYFLALMLLKYGFDKIFKHQFYLPEPNILFTPFGQLDIDILFWSTMGVSNSYNIFMGLLEVIPAVMLFWQRTRILGLLVALPVLINVVAINFSFDISVKVFSLFLLVINLFLLAPFSRSLMEFLLHQKTSKLRYQNHFLSNSLSLKVVLKTFLIGLIFLEALFPYVLAQNFNDDLVQRPYLHGVYEIESVKRDDWMGAMADFPIKRLFIHRNGYLIFQDQEDKMTDFRLEIDQKNRKFRLTDYDLKTKSIPFYYSPNDSTLTLEYSFDNQINKVRFKALNWQKMPVFNQNFHWTIEGVK